jgi:hypothetical protein
MSNTSFLPYKILHLPLTMVSIDAAFYVWAGMAQSV